MAFKLFLFVFLVFSFNIPSECYIRPQETTIRQTKSLDGIWKWKMLPELGLEPTRNESEMNKNEVISIDKDYILMPVPSSFNDITQSVEIRDYVGWYRYVKEFILHDTFYNEQINDLYVHFGSVNYHCEVRVNGQFIGSHSSGHLPFEFKISSVPGLKLNLNGKNTIEVLANNILTMQTTIPQARTYFPSNSTNNIYPTGYKVTDSWFDFFNYAGIHRSVTLLTKPKIFIERVDFNFVKESEELVYLNYSVTIRSLSGEFRFTFVKLTLIDNEDNIVTTIKGLTGKQLIENPKLWYPYTMIDNQTPNLYKLNIKLIYKTNGSLVDEVEIRTGIRFVEIRDNKLFINSRRAYLTGFGKHEDIDLKGRGLDLAHLIKDFNLIKWIQANSFRTSHYPYSEELMDLADEYGVLIIDECPAVGLQSFERSTLDVHKQQLEALISRDKHHPSVLFWSVANEAESQKPESDSYFKEVTDYVHSLDPTRLITAAINKQYNECKLTKYLDVIAINRYVAWYSNSGRLELIRNQINHELDLFFENYSKPIMISEYGADTVAGLHQDPSRLFSEDYQVDYLRQHFDAFDDLFKKGYFIGEHYWNFADFMTKQDYTRVLGNKKGLFTRDRQPKSSAKVMRCRYSKLAANLDLRKFETDHQMYC